MFLIVIVIGLVGKYNLRYSQLAVEFARERLIVHYVDNSIFTGNKIQQLNKEEVHSLYLCKTKFRHFRYCLIIENDAVLIHNFTNGTKTND